MEMKKNQLVINDQLINYYQFGGGKRAVVFLHGWRSSAEAWFGVVPKILNDNLTIYCLDLPGFGGSPLPLKTFRIQDYAQIVSGFIGKVYAGKKVILAGHSFGGRIAIRLSSSQPELIDKLILVDSAGIKKEHKARKVVARFLKPLFKIGFLQGLRSRIYQKMGSEDYLATPELRDTYLNAIGDDLTPCLSQIKASTLIIWGREDTSTPVADARQMHSLITGSKIHVIENAGHFSFIDNPDEFSKSIINFIGKCD